MKTTDYTDLVRNIEDDLRKGAAASVAERLRHLNLKQVPREFRIKLAQAFRRCGLTDHAFRVLTPAVRDESADAPTAAELVEYSFCLIRGGSFDEARETLESVNEADEPKKLFALAFCHVSNWNYVEAIPYFKKYLQLIAADKYQHLVVRVNLAAAQVHIGALSEAGKNIAELRANCESLGHRRLLINLKELEAQAAIQAQDLVHAEALLDQAAAEMPSGELKDALFIHKWRAVIESIKTRSAQPLLDFKKIAEEKKHWETGRDCDYQILRHGLSRDPLERLYYGTPYEAYKREIEKAFGPVADRFEWNGPAERTFCLSSGSEDHRATVNLGKNNHRLLDLLSRDFYRPIPIGTLFNGLFPDEKFSIFSSVNRVHQSVTRLRKWLKSNDMPILIEEHHGEYRLIFTGDYALRRGKDLSEVNNVSVFESKVRDNFGLKLFSRKEAEVALATSSSSAHRILSGLLDSEIIVRHGSGARTRYQLNSTKKAA